MTKNVMVKIWDRNPSMSEVIGRGGGDEKTTDHTDPTKNAKKTKFLSIKMFVRVCTKSKLCLLSLYAWSKVPFLWFPW